VQVCNLAAMDPPDHYVSQSATGDNDGSSWADAHVSLQDALAAALPGETIWVAAGTYYPDEGAGQTDNNRSASFALKSGLAIYGGFPASGEPGFAERRPADHVTVLSGDIDQNDGPDFANNAGNARKVVTADGVNEFLLDGFSITAGNANGAFPADRGGGLDCNDIAQASITNCIFHRNMAAGGGGVSIRSSSAPFISELSFTNCVFIGNRASNGGGGILVTAPAALTNCSFQGNVATTSGGAVFNALTPITFSNCILWNNAAAGQTNTASASVITNFTTNVYNHSLVQNLDLSATGTGNLNGTDPANNPRFVAEINPLAPGTSVADLRLLSGSPLIHAGRDADNPTATDLAGNPRKIGTIDLGAYEQEGYYFVKKDGNDGASGLSWADAFATVQQALAVAEAGQPVYIAAGTYYPDEGPLQTANARSSTFALKSGVPLHGGFPASGNPLFTERDPASHPTILSGDIDQNDPFDPGNNSGNAYHVLTADGVDAAGGLDGFTITAGHANGSGAPDDRGGGIHVTGGSAFAVTRCRIHGNAATFGAGISIENSSPVLTNSTFQGNAAASSGGALHLAGGSPVLTNCSLQGNSAGSSGGAIHVSASSPDLINTIVWNNAAAGQSDTSSASIDDDASAISYSHCLVENLDLTVTGTGNLDGTDPLNDPRFAAESDPADAPAAGGDLRLVLGSPALDSGDSSANPSTRDVDGLPRKVGPIDLGAHEQQGILHVRPDGDDAADGSSWSEAFATVQHALATATANQAIWVAAGTYYPDEGPGQTNNNRSASFALKPGVGLYGGFPASGNPGFTARDPAAHPTVLSGDIDQNDGPDFTHNAGNAYQVVIANGTDGAARLDGFVITAGNANGAFPLFLGGGIWLDDETQAVIANCRFLGNRATLGGAAFSSGDAVFTHCSFAGNFATSKGGAVFSGRSEILLINCSFQGNAAGFGGGAFCTSQFSMATLINCSIQGNAAEEGGGALINESFRPCHLINSIVWNNANDGRTNTADASVGGLGRTTYSHSLVQNLDLRSSGSGNFDGTDPLNDPRFLAELDPLAAPGGGGSLRLIASSPALNAGDDAADAALTDLDGFPRKVGRIDLGAYEQQGLIHVRETGDDSADGSSWSEAFATLQHALSIATPRQAILVAAGSYHPDEGPGQTADDRDSTFELPSGVEIHGGFPATGEPTFGERDPAAHPTVLSGDIDQNDGPGFANRGGNAYHVLTADGTDSAARLDGLVISGGNANGSAAPANRGGGLRALNGASLVVFDCRFQANAASQGGAIHLTNSAPQILNCRFLGNHATGSGAALYNLGAAPAVTNSLFLGNAADGNGGAVSNEMADPLLTNCSFQGNAAGGTGGALFNLTSSPVLSNCILWNNAAAGLTGTASASVGGVGSTPAYSHCLIANLDLSGTAGNFDGTELLNDPRFTQEADPLAAPGSIGDLRLLPGSPAINAGDNAANRSTTDLDGDARRIGRIDLGPYERENIYRVRPGGDDNANGLSWDQAFATLQKALAVATPDEPVWLAAGTYHPDEGPGQTDNSRAATFALKAGVTLYGGFPATGDPAFLDRDPAVHLTILSGDIDQNDGPDFANNAGNSHHVITANGVLDARLDGCVVSAGNSAAAPFPLGSAFYSLNGSSCTFADCHISGNDGIAIYNGLENGFNGPAPTLILTASTLQGNRGNFGGAICSVGSNLVITGCKFRNNVATDQGGAIYLFGDSVNLTNCIFQGNSAVLGGAIYHGSGSSPVITNCSFQGNAAGSLGGGIYCNSSPLTLTNSIVWNNSAGGQSGTPDASMSSSNTQPVTYAHSLVQNLDLRSTGTGNFDGTDPLNDPRFVAEVDPLAAPIASGGDLRFFPGSPVIDAGDSSANSSTSDLAGAPRKVGIIDLGAYEGPVDDPAILWETDFDRDGRPYGIEIANGTDPDASDRDPLASFGVDGNGRPVMKFTRSPAPSANYLLKVTRSPDLSPGSFVEIFRISPGGGGTDTEGGNSFGVDPATSQVTFTDEDPPEGSAFYRLEADYSGL
jgi:hypothetical protein